MPDNTDNGRLESTRFLSGKLGSTRRIIAGSVVLVQGDPFVHFLDGGASDRSVLLPLLSSGDDWRIIANVGATNSLLVKTSSGAAIATLGVKESALFFGSNSEWITIRGSSLTGDVFGPAGVGHVKGLVPDPGPTAGLNRFLADDGSWTTVGSLGSVDAFKRIFDGTNTAIASGLDQLRIRSSDSSIILVATNNDGTFGDVINFTVDPSHVNHNLLLNYIANQHIDHTSVSISTAEGLQGGGDISSTRTLKLNFSALGTSTPALSDTIAYFQTATHFKTTWTAINAILDHNGLLNYTANRHIDHSVVSMIAGTGLSGGGDLTTSRTFNIALGGLTTTSSMLSGDLLLLSRGATPEAITFANFNAALDASIMVNYHDVTKSNLAGGNVFTGNETISPISPASPAIAIFTPTSTLGQGFSINQTGAGVAPLVAPFILGNFAYNGIMINDAVDASATFGVVGGLIVQTNVAGATAQGFHGAGIFNANVNGVVPTNGTFGGVQGVSALAQSLYPMGGTGTGAGLGKGAIYGFGSIAIAYGPGGSGAGAWPGATNILNMTGLEINVGAKAGSSLSYKSGIQIASFADDVVQGTLYDTALSISSQGGLWRHGILFSRANGSDPISTTGTLIGTLDAATIAHGIDLSNYTCTSDCFKSAGIIIDGAGNITTTGFGHFGGSTGSVLSVTSGVNDGLRINDGTVTGVFWSSSALTHSAAIGTISTHPLTFITDNALRASLSTTGVWTWNAYTQGVLVASTAGVITSAALTDGQIIVGQTGATPLAKTLTGDVTLSAAGAFTLTTAQPLTHTWAANQVFSSKIGIGNASPKTLMDANSNTASPALAFSASLGRYMAADGAIGAFEVVSFGSAGVSWVGAAAGGTGAVPLATPFNTSLTNFSGYGHNGTSFQLGGAMVLSAGSLWSGTNQETNVQFYVTPLNATAFILGAKVNSSGGFSVGSAAADPGAGIVNVTTGYRIANVAASGNVLRGNGTNFVSAVLANTDISGLGTASTQNTGTSGANVPLLNGANTWSATQAFTNTTNSGTLAITGTSQFTGNITLLNATSGNNQGSLAFSYNSVNDSNLRTYANSDISIVDSYVTTNYPSTNAFGRVFDIMAAGGNVGAHLRLMTQNINSAAVQAAHVWPTGGVYIGTSNSVDPGAQNLTTGGYLQTAGYTVAGLPAASAANKGAIAYVTDALAPTFLATVVGGGAIVTPVFCNGTNWVGG